MHLDLEIGEHAVDYSSMAEKDKLTELQLRLKQLLNQVDQIAKEQAYQRVSWHFTCACIVLLGIYSVETTDMYTCVHLSYLCLSCAITYELYSQSYIRSCTCQKCSLCIHVIMLKFVVYSIGELIVSLLNCKTT